MKHGIMISDLHLFAKRSKADGLNQELQGLLSSQDVLVLNGDIFDFRWSQYSNLQETIKHATKWFDDTHKSFPNLKIVYVLGNHDFNYSFIHALKDLKERNERFTFFEFYAFIEDCLFLHGDCTNRFISFDHHKQLRDHWAKGSRWPSFLSYGYQVLDIFQLPKFLHSQKFTNKKVAQRILHYISTIPGGIPSGIKNIYMGHTHLPMESFIWNNYHLHNSGSAISGFDWKIIHFTLQENAPWKGR